MSNKEREILFIRHGLSEGNENPDAYIEGDPPVSLEREGTRQLIRSGMYTSEYLREQKYEDWPLIVTGEFNRHLQSGGALMFGMGNAFEGKPTIHHDTRLNEISFGILPHTRKSDGEVEGILNAYSKAVKEGNDFSAVPIFGESSRFAHIAMKSFLDGTAERDFQQGHDCMIIVTSGRPIQVGLMNLMHIPMSALEDGTLENPNNGDIISVRGTETNLIAEKIWDGPSATAVRENIMDNIEPISLVNVPDDIKNEPEFQHLCHEGPGEKFEL
ncbi:MAG: histidine phosphatase family protein [Alphaproteobacteria bacterium]